MSKRLHLFFESPENNPGFLFWKVSNLWQRNVNAVLKKIELTHVQFMLLAGIARLGEEQKSIRQIQLASYTNIDVMMTSSVVRTLEKKKLITRVSDKEDSRAKCLSITDLGKKRLRKALKLVEKFDKKFFSTMKGKKADFIKGLSSLISS